jgi:diguanylate cyclase (GGDEF)-like protein
MVDQGGGLDGRAERDDADRAGREFGGMATGFLIGYLQQQAPGAVEGILSAAGETRPVEELVDPGSWSTYGQLRRLFEATSASLGGRQALRAAGEASLESLVAPEVIEMVRAKGTPGAYLETMGREHTVYFPVIDLELEEAAEGDWHIDLRFQPGYEPFPEFCGFFSGLLACVPKLFGFTSIVMEEEACQCDGMPSCHLHMAWSTEDVVDSSRQEALHSRLFGARLQALQRTVVELVSGEGLESVLPRIIAAAGRAVQAPRYILSIDVPPVTGRRLYWDGTDEAGVRRIMDRLHEDPDTDRPHVLISEVTSVRAHYGRLIAVRAPGEEFNEAEGLLLDTYARLAAAALDSASALDTARREATTSRALLELARSLVELDSAENLAHRLALAVPSVVDCDRAVVAVFDRAAAGGRLVATSGYADPEAEGRARRHVQSIPPPLGHANELVWHDVVQLTPAEPGGLGATTTMEVAGELIGWISVEVTHDPDRLRNAPDLADKLQGLAGIAAVAVNNTQLLEEIRHQSLHDSLTGLPNRVLILDRIGQMLARARRSQSDVALFYIDLDAFKEVNDTLGHAAGDELLKAVGSRFARVLRATDTVGRLGGDEFVVLSERMSPGSGPEVVAQRLLDVLAEPFHLAGKDGTPRAVTASASIGVAAGERDDALEMLQDGDVALYAAKAAGKSRYVLFQPEMQEAIRTHHQMESELRAAVGTEQFFLLYQPIFDLRQMRLRGAEALVRWRHPMRGVVGPDEIIPILEATGMIVDVGRWVLRQACRQARAWAERGQPLTVSVNVSGCQLEGDLLVDDVRAALDESRLDASSLTLEITETVLMRDTDLAVRQLTALRALGVRLAIDDFGTGYSSLSYLRRFPLDAIKIDRSFITGLGESRASEALVHTLVQLGKTLELETVAEGVEEPRQLQRLQAEHCDSGQGFLLSHPLSPEDMDRFLERHRLEVASAAVAD